LPGSAALAPEQRALLELIARQRRSYGELAELLGRDVGSVRARAHAAGDALLAGAEGRPTDEVRGLVTDYVLRQQTLSERLRTRELLNDSARARAWAKRLRGEMPALGGVVIAGRASSHHDPVRARRASARRAA
jgi:hypothetical protein